MDAASLIAMILSYHDIREPGKADPAKPVAARLWQRVCSVCALLIIVGVVLGGLNGIDDEWPFAPFRMFAYKPQNTGTVTAVAFRGVTSVGETKLLTDSDFNLRRAEFEGQLPKIVSNPRMLASLVSIYNKKHPGRDRLVRLELLKSGWNVVDRKPKERIEDTIALWPPNNEPGE